MQNKIMLKKYNWLLAGLLFWSACSNRDFPPDMPADPVFTTQFTVDGEIQSLEAGVEDIYLFTRFEKDDANVLVLGGTFAQADCPAGDCPGSLTFEFRNDRTGSEVFIDTLLSAGNKTYYFDQPVTANEVFRYKFYAPDSADYSLLQWRIDNDTPVTTKTLIREFVQDTVHQVRLWAFRNGALKSVVAHTVNSDTISNVFPKVNIDIQVDSIGGGTQYLLTADTQGSPVSSFQWSNGANTQQIAVSETQEIYAVHVESPAGDTAYAGIFTIDPTINKTADFGYTVEHIVSNPDTLYLNRINIRWIDESGGTWESRRGTQTPDAFFHILSSEPYDPNENGQKTRKMEVSYSCRLYNVLEPLLSRIIVGTGVIAVAYP
ncbi:MAG TPA: hypothetical protein PLO67_14870 [Saprospiraceae bacterium]|nr:hypothetical protein [Saprospiraceae bacterium]HPI06868.1 hypothetical protein [Saprospiraceae bacterium]